MTRYLDLGYEPAPTTTFAEPTHVVELTYITPKSRKLAMKVYDWATEKYNSRKYAWHQIVECWTIDEIAEQLQSASITSTGAAITHFRKIARSLREQELNARDW